MKLVGIGDRIKAKELVVSVMICSLKPIQAKGLMDVNIRNNLKKFFGMRKCFVKGKLGCGVLGH
ncbi:hypothetical protein GCM10027284_33310 [Cyclobacterium sediminis]